MSSYQHQLMKKGVVQSMSRKGNCLDNSVMENFFGLLKSAFFCQAKFDSIEHFQTKLKEYIAYYNTIRIKEKLDGMSPVQYRLRFSSIA